MKKLIAIVLSSLLLIGAAVGGTLALASDEERTVNVYTAGNINIALVNGDNDSLTLFPAVYDFTDEAVKADPWALNDENLWANIRNVYQKDLAVKNVGKNDAYIRVIVAYENPRLDDGSFFFEKCLVRNEAVSGTVISQEVMIDGTNYALVSYLFANKVTPNKDTEHVVLRQLAIDTDTTSEQMAKIGENYNLLVCAQAVQTDSVNDATTMLNAAFGALSATAHPWAAPNNPGTIVINAEQFREALEQGGKITLTGVVNPSADTVSVVPGWSDANTMEVFISEATVISGGTLKLDEHAKFGMFVYTPSGDTTIENMTVTTNSQWSIHIVGASGRTVTLNNVNVEAEAGAGIYAYSAGSTTILNNVKVNHKALDDAYASSTPWAATAVATSNGHDMIINGGTYVGTTYGVYIYNSGGNITINGGTFKAPNVLRADGCWNSNPSAIKSVITVNGGNFDGKISTDWGDKPSEIRINGGTFTNFSTSLVRKDGLIITGGTFDADPSEWVANGYEVTNNGDGTYTVDRDYVDVTIPATGDKDTNGAALGTAISNTTGNAFLKLPAGEYKMPSVGGTKEVTIVGTKDTVIDNTMGAYMDGSKVSFEGVTIKGSTGMANGNGSDYAALYTENVTYTNCTFDGPFRIGRDGATFINCTFTNLGNDYIWTYGNDVTFIGCTFNTDGKAILIYSDGGNEVSKVTVKDCVFNATQGAKAGAIANQNCAAIEIQNYGNGVDLTLEGNTYNTTYFSGEWRIKAYHSNRPDVIVNGVKYTSIAIDGKLMTIDGSNNVTVNG